MADTLEQRARELLAATYEARGADALAARLRDGCPMQSSFDHVAIQAITAALQAQQPGTVCSDCPPVGYPTDATRCDPCPRKAQQPGAQAVESYWCAIDSDETIRFSLKAKDCACGSKAERKVKGWMREQLNPSGYQLIRLYTNPQPPSIPEPSEEDVIAASRAFCVAYRPVTGMRAGKTVAGVHAALTDYTARLRERIGGGNG